jgi:hypothetical protein
MSAGLFENDPAVPDIVIGQGAMPVDLGPDIYLATWLRAKETTVVATLEGLDAARMFKPKDKSWNWHYSPHSPILGHWYREVGGIREYIMVKRQSGVVE